MDGIIDSMDRSLNKFWEIVKGRETLQPMGLQRVNSLEKTLMLGKIEGRRRREQWRMR